MVGSFCLLPAEPVVLSAVPSMKSAAGGVGKSSPGVSNSDVDDVVDSVCGDRPRELLRHAFGEATADFGQIGKPAGVAPEFVNGIADLVLERESVGAAGSEKRKALSPLGPWRDFCSADCCPNARRQLPVVAEL